MTAVRTMIEENSRVARHANLSLSRYMDNSPKSKTDVALQGARAEVVIMDRKIQGNPTYIL